VGLSQYSQEVEYYTLILVNIQSELSAEA